MLPIRKSWMFHVRPGVCALVLGACLSARCDEVSSVEAREAMAGWAALGGALTEADIFGGRQIAGVATYDGGETATATIPLEGENPPAFFNAKIEED